MTSTKPAYLKSFSSASSWTFCCHPRPFRRFNYSECPPTRNIEPVIKSPVPRYRFQRSLIQFDSSSPIHHRHPLWISRMHRYHLSHLRIVCLYSIRCFFKENFELEENDRCKSESRRDYGKNPWYRSCVNEWTREKSKIVDTKMFVDKIHSSNLFKFQSLL